MASSYRWCAFDVETAGPRSAWRGGSIRSDQVRLWTEDRDRWVAVLRDHAERGYTLVAHNAEYDVMTGLWPAGQDVTIHYYNGAFTTAYWFHRRRGSSAQIWDSMLLSGGLALWKVGQAVGLPKLETPQVLQGKDPDRYAWLCEDHGRGECLECYALRDVDIVHRYMVSLEAFLGGWSLEPRRTLASCAVGLWKLLDPGQQLPLRAGRVQALAMAARHGGRNEAFMYGRVEPVYTYDVSRHYPAVMLECPMPDPRYLVYAEGNPRQLQLEGREGVIEAEVYVPPSHVPVLPVTWRDRLYFPVGLVRGAWAYCELRAAVDRGARVIRVHRQAWTTRTVQPFHGYETAMLYWRDEYARQGDPREAVTKTLANALTGRLGMVTGGERAIYRRRTLGMRPDVLQGAEVQLAGTNAYLVKRHQVPRPPTTSNVLWAVSIWAYGRVRLLEHLETAGAELVYCDTDSVFSTRQLGLRDPGPGRLRDTGFYPAGEFFGPKHYRLYPALGDPLAVAKGIPRELADRYYREGEVRFSSALGVQEAVHRGAEPGLWLEVTKGQQLVPARRQLLNPEVLADRTQRSDTEPVVFSAGGPETVDALVDVTTSA